jgi:cobalt-zinc-cadmium efflux system outer membrane protein
MKRNQQAISAGVRSLGRCLITILVGGLASAVASGQSAVVGDGSPGNALAGNITQAQGSTPIGLVRRALDSNAELAASRLDIARARARLRQAGLRPNPAIDFEQTNGVMNSPGERVTSVGLSVPLEIGGKRRRRIDLAQAELAAAEAAVADRERRLANDVRIAYAEAMAAQRELSLTVEINNLDTQTVRVVETRVIEGETAPLELNLLRVELERLRSRRALVEGRLQAAMLRLKSLAGVPMDEALRLDEEFAATGQPSLPTTLDAAIEIALGARPDLRLAKLTEEVAEAGYQLAKAQAAPEVTAFTRYTDNRNTFDETPIGLLTDRDKLFTYGVTITLPFFNRNQGAKAEAQISIAQAQRRREFAESVIRAEVASAWRRHEAARRAVLAFEQGVLARSDENVRAIRGAYQLGAYRVTDLLAEQRRLVDSQREYTEALTERCRSLADLQAAIGEPNVQGQPRNESK